MATGKSVTPPGVGKKGGSNVSSEDTEVLVKSQPEKSPRAPRVTVSSRGKISRILEGIAAEYERLHPDRKVRWVFDSSTKPELSNLLSRTMEGYSLVESKDFQGYPVEGYVDKSGRIRVADVVLMSIPEDLKKENVLERQRVADDQVRRVKEGFDSAMQMTRQGEHRAAARGAVKIREVDHDLNYEQPEKE